MSQSITLDALQEQHFDWLLQIEAAARREGFIRGNDRAGHAAFFAQADSLYLRIMCAGEPAGYVILSGFSGPDKVIELGRIVIDEAFRGIGQMALKAIIARIFADPEIHKIWLDTLDHNLKGQHIYTKLGFTLEGRLRETFLMNDRRHDMLIYGLLREEWLAQGTGLLLAANPVTKSEQDG